MGYKDRNLAKRIYDQILNINHYNESDEEEEQTSKMNSKYNPVNNKSNLDLINYLASEHAQCLQQSQYIKFENDVGRIMEHDGRFRRAQITRANLGISQEFQRQKLLTRYCKEQEVVEKNQVFLVFKGQFLAKLKNISSNGQCMRVQGKVDSWIEQNWEELYNKMANGKEEPAAKRAKS